MSDPVEAQASAELTLQRAVQDAYRAFGRYRAPTQTLDVCLACCVDPKIESEMRRLPLRSLGRQHFYEYNSSAKSVVQPAVELKYYLPRMLELLAQGEEIHHSVEISLQRMGNCPADAFSLEEKRVVADFALAHFATGLAQWWLGSVGVFSGSNAFDILLMWDYASPLVLGDVNVDIQPLLAHWMNGSNPSSTLHFVDTYYFDYLLDEREIANAFASDRPAFRAAMKQWLDSAPCKDAFVPKLLELIDQEVWKGVDDARHPHPLKQRIESAFYALSE